MVLLMCHTHYTLTQPETLGLIDNTLLNKNLKTNVMEVHCILNAIFNGKQMRLASSMLTKIGVEQTIRTTHALAQILSRLHVYYTLRHCNARGCEYGRRETLVRCCSNYGPSSSIAASVWHLVAAYPVYIYSHSDRLLYPALFFKSITLRV